MSSARAPLAGVMVEGHGETVARIGAIVDPSCSVATCACSQASRGPSAIVQEWCDEAAVCARLSKTTPRISGAADCSHC